MNNIEQELFSNEDFFNPFGPNFLRLKINEDIRLKILDAITDLEKTPTVHPSTLFNGNINNTIKNSIIDGRMGEIWDGELKKDKPWNTTHHENIIKNTIQEVLCKYGEHYYNMPCISSTALVWYVILKAGDFHMLHSHRHPSDTAELSGAIYLKVPDNLPHPQGNINWTIGGSPSELYNSTWECSPEPGDVFLWPAWLMHGVYPFRSKQERVMISFNGAVSPI